MNDEEEFNYNYYKRYEREPKYNHALFICREKRGEILTDAGVSIKASRNGFIIQYTRKNGSVITSLVHSREQYLVELYRINLIAESEHPELIKVEIPKKENRIMEDKIDKRK